MKKIYVIETWNPWNCQCDYPKAFLTKKAAKKYVEDYELKKDVEEEIRVIEIERG